MTAHDALCACALREHSCENSWAGTSCTKCQCHKIARVRADERARQVEVMAAYARARQATRGGVDRIIARTGGAW